MDDLPDIKWRSKTCESPRTQCRDNFACRSATGQENTLYARANGPHLCQKGQILIHGTVGVGDDDTEGTQSQSKERVGMPGRVLDREVCCRQRRTNLAAQCIVWFPNDDDSAHFALR